MIYIIGLGNSNTINEKTLEIIKSCDKVVLKTVLCNSSKIFLKTKINHITLDSIYKKSRNFDTLNKNLVKEIISLSKQYKNIAYLVDGSGYEDNSVSILFKKTKDIKIISSVSKANILSNYPTSSYTVYSAYDFSSNIEINQEFPLVIYEIDNNMTAGDIKLLLFKYYAEDTKILYCSQNNVINISLFELDRQKNYDYSTSILLSPQDLLNKKRYTFGDLLKIMNILRGDNGCPWDREQNHQSIKMNAVEEAYELIEAIDNNDFYAMEEEIGDLLLQPVFQSKIAEDQKEFDINDVLSTLCKKLVFRHSHIFGKDKAEKSAEALVTWENNKNKEKGQDTYTKSLKGVAKSFPAIIRSEKVQKRAAKCGFDFENDKDAFAKVTEELEELKQGIKNKDIENIKEECGDLLFSVVNLLRILKVIDGETALNNTTDKFIKRFEYMENTAIKQGKNLDNMTLEEMEKLYSDSKK